MCCSQILPEQPALFSTIEVAHKNRAPISNAMSCNVHIKLHIFGHTPSVLGVQTQLSWSPEASRFVCSTLKGIIETAMRRQKHAHQTVAAQRTTKVL